MLSSVLSEPSRRKDHPRRTLILKCDNASCGRIFEKRYVTRIANAPVHACSRACQGVLQHKNGALDLHKQALFVERYGVDNPLKDPVIAARVRETNMERYGVPVSSQNADVQARARATNQEHFGVDWHTQSENFSCKARMTWHEKYGVDHPMRADVVKAKYDFRDIWSKAHATKKLNGTYARSAVEDEFANVLFELFGADSVERQVALNGWIIDFRIKNIDTYVQFDGAYWHGLDRPLDEINRSTSPRDVAILQAYERDRVQDVWFTENGLFLVRITDQEFMSDPHSTVLKILSIET